MAETTYYLEYSNPSDIGGYQTIRTTDTAGALVERVMSTGEMLNSVHPAIVAEFVTEPSSTPGGTTITAVYGFLASMWARTDVLANVFELTVDLLRYKDSGTIASASVFVEFYVEPGNAGLAARDHIKRGSGSWITDGFTPGCRILVAGSTYNDGTYLVQDVSQFVLTLAPGEQLTKQDDGFKEQATVTISTKEKWFAGATSGQFSDVLQQKTWTNSGNIPDETFAAADRLVVKLWVRRVAGNSDVRMMVQFEGTHDATVVIS